MQKNKNLMDQKSATEIVSIAKEVYRGNCDSSLERSRIVSLYGENSKAVKLFDRVVLTGKIPLFTTIDVPHDDKKIVLQVVGMYSAAILIWFLFPSSWPKTFVCMSIMMYGFVMLTKVAEKYKNNIEH
jgi:hypothetical protein